MNAAVRCFGFFLGSLHYVCSTHVSLLLMPISLVPSTLFLSERALALTGLRLKLNPSNYTVWHYRRQILLHLHSSNQPQSGEDAEEGTEPISTSPLPSFVRDDLSLAAQLGGRNPKNYQIWYHRRAMLQPILQTTSTATTTSPYARSLDTPTSSSSSSSAIAMASSTIHFKGDTYSLGQYCNYS
jgi:hypothetical protein